MDAISPTAPTGFAQSLLDELRRLAAQRAALLDTIRTAEEGLVVTDQQTSVLRGLMATYAVPIPADVVATETASDLRELEQAALEAFAGEILGEAEEEAETCILQQAMDGVVVEAAEAPSAPLEPANDPSPSAERASADLPGDRRRGRPKGSKNKPKPLPLAQQVTSTRPAPLATPVSPPRPNLTKETPRKGAPQQDDVAAAIARFERDNNITRCPAAHVGYSSATISREDREKLSAHAAKLAEAELQGSSWKRKRA